MRESKLSTAVSQQLVSSLSSVKSLVNTAINHPDLLHTKSKALQSLSKATRDLDMFTTNCMRDKSTLPIRRQVKYLLNSVSSLAQAVDSDEIDVESFLESVVSDVSVRVDSLELLAESSADHIDLDSEEITLDDFEPTVSTSARSVELGDMRSSEDYANKIKDLTDRRDTLRSLLKVVSDLKRPSVEAKIDMLEKQIEEALIAQRENSTDAAAYRANVGKLNQFEKYRSKLASRLSNVGSIVPIQIPIAVRFDAPSLRSPAKLESVFPKKVDVLGMSDLRSTDISIILKDQILMQFSKKDAIEHAEQDIKVDDVSVRLKEARKTLNALKKRQRVAQEELEKIDTEEQQLRKSAGRRFGPKSQREFEQRREVARKQLLSLDESIAKNTARVSSAGSVKRAKSKVNLDKNTVYFNRVNQFLSELAERGKHYTLVSNQFLTSPNNADIALAWVILTAQYKRLVALSNGNTGVGSWGLPWTIKQSKRTLVAPESLDLSVKLGRS